MVHTSVLWGDVMLRWLGDFFRYYGRLVEPRRARRHKSPFAGTWVNKNPDPYGEEDWVYKEKVTKLGRKCYITVTETVEGYCFIASYTVRDGADEVIPCDNEYDAFLAIELMEPGYSVLGKVTKDIRIRETGTGERG